MPKAKNYNTYLRPVTLGAQLMETHMRIDEQELSTQLEILFQERQYVPMEY